MSDKPVFTSPADLMRPMGYSHVVDIPAGRLVWTAGQVGADADGNFADGIAEQTRLAFENVGKALAAGGAGWNDVVKLTIYVVGAPDLAVLREVRDELVNTETPPTSTLVQVAGLARPELLIEVEAVAWVA